MNVMVNKQELQCQLHQMVYSRIKLTKMLDTLKDRLLSSSGYYSKAVICHNQKDKMIIKNIQVIGNIICDQT